ncbi:MAG: type II toxin-antitoxin system HipA family toxin [Planctomycetes bacterium]|nr:type II toxin-antitoxin system HipA family toxin [Planctomycetota bacterium]MCP4770196.1 type II toxin-antitoxin system HipA family toxin [Planctomycetota bacterium]MCP4860656.1 type II toxin-antitoxin system HipA family toxin [Planctomycetota bacterium]
MTTARVNLWGTAIGAVYWDEQRELGSFEYEPNFLRSGIEIAPLQMPLAPTVYSFPALNRDTFHGLPGLLADVLPDRFGNALIDAWLASQGRTAQSFNPVERLCYSGTRGIGALEFAPSMGNAEQSSNRLDVAALVDLAGRILTQRSEFRASLKDGEEGRALRDILRVGTSAGGARAKAVIAWNPQSGEVRSGHADSEKGFSHWLLKFDGVASHSAHDLADSKGYGRIEYAYHRMALAAGIDMTECRLLHENGRSHFVTKRFDRKADGAKIHQQSLCAMAHFDFNMAGAYSYEQAMLVMRELGLPMASIEQQFRRAVFNIVARNQDDHVKNIAFLMDKGGQWALSPAFDVTYSYNPDGPWTSSHQMSFNGKRRGFVFEDFEACAKTMSMQRTHVAKIVEQVVATVENWPQFAAAAQVPEQTMKVIASTHRLILPS